MMPRIGRNKSKKKYKYKIDHNDSFFDFDKNMTFIGLILNRTIQPTRKYLNFFELLKSYHPS